jgi:multiple sugar transport system substrate-binding protein
MKKIFLLVTIIFTCLSFTACQPPDNIVIDNRVEFVEKDATEVSLWVNDFEEWNNQINIKQRMDFNDIEDDGIQLNQNLIEVNSFEDLIRSARETNNVPDIYMVSYGNIYKEVQNGNIVDLTDYFSTDVWNDVLPIAKEAVSYDSKQYAFPILMEPSSLLFYRKDLLQQYGKTSNVPSKWSDFVSLLETIKKNINEEGRKGIYPFDVPKGVALSWATWGMQVSATEGLAVTDDWTTSRLENDGYKDLANLWSDLYENNYVPLSSGDYTEVINDLCLDKLVMTTAGSWSIATIIKEFPDLVNQIGVMPMPTFDGEQNGVTATIGGWAYVISKESEHKEEAAEVIKYLVAENVDKSLEYFTEANYSKTPPRKTVQTAITNQLEEQSIVPNEWIEVLLDVSNRGALEPIYSWDISLSVSTMLENAALGNNISSEISIANQAVIEIISDEKLSNKNPRGE